ncbi:MAG: nuclear transport factor 2 family protein [Chloroflexota bacterium]
MSQSSPFAVIERLHDATNRHDLDAFVACFAEDYDSQQPVYPERAFVGSAQVRKNWSRLFEGMPDLHVELLRSSVTGDEVWGEWEWRGTWTDGALFHIRGVMIYGIRNGQIAWARLYTEPVADQGFR